MTEEKLIVTSSPHLHSGASSVTIMRDVLLALVPVVLAATVIFGPRSLLVILTCVTSCVLSEFLFRRFLKRTYSIYDLTAVITGVLLALNLPVSIPLWMAAIGGFVAIVIVKECFGGLGQNFVNPAITARIVLLMSFSSAMSVWNSPFYYLHHGEDVVTSASYFQALQTGGPLPSLLDMFLGMRSGSLGETSALALLLGFGYLLYRRIITPTIPLIFIGTVGVLSLILGGDPLSQMMSGGLLLGAVFMATDYTTSPTTAVGQAIYAFGCGLITVLIRFYAALPEGVSYAILLMNIITPLIDRYTIPKAFGTKKEASHS